VTDVAPASTYVPAPAGGPVSAPGPIPGSTPRAPRAELAALTAAAEAVGGLVGGAGKWTAEDRWAALASLDRVVDALAAARAAVLVAERECRTWQGAGDRSLATWRARTAGTGHRSAVTQIRQAEHLAAAPGVVAAVTEGRIGLEHAAVLAKVAATGSAAQRAAVHDADTRGELLALAREQDADTYATTVARWAAGVDPAALERDNEARRRERYLSVSETPHGAYLKGRLSTIAGRRLTLALEALTPRPAADDDRDAGQRRADALDAMATRILALADTKPGAHVPPQITMILTEETWVAARAERDRRRSDSTSASGGTDSTSATGAADLAPHATVGYPPATLEDGIPVPATELAVAMCDCAITRLVIDADGVPIDLGRTQRLFSGEQRRAVIARDRECIWPTCHMPARWCDIHHREWWERDNGPTSVDNGALLCGFHHHETHRRDLSITRIGVPSVGGSPPRRGRPGGRPPGRLALVAYEFRDRTGNLVTSDDDVVTSHHDVARPGASVSGRSDDESPPGDGPPPPTGQVPTQPSARGDVTPRSPQADELDLTWTTDPVTGGRVPSYFLDP
jgi:hypothetical protein